MSAFNLEEWKRRVEHNSKEAERNSLMDSGWSVKTAERCVATFAGLLRELAAAMAEIETRPEDFFDRPDLVAVQEAARFVTGPKVHQ